MHAGLAVAMPFIHTRPKYFAQIIGELLYWVGEDRIQFASDYALWTPRWLIEAFVDFQIPEDLSEYAPITTDQKKKILGLNAAKMYDIPVPAELQLPSAGEPAVVRAAPTTWLVRDMESRYDQAYAALSRGRRSRARRADHRSGVCALAGGDAGRKRQVHLRLPTSFCAPNFAYLMASDAKDVLSALDWTRHVVVELDDHHDSEIINAGLAADAGYRGTFGHEAEESLDDLRETFRRKAHTAAMERCLTALLRADPQRSRIVVGRGPSG